MQNTTAPSKCRNRDFNSRYLVPSPPQPREFHCAHLQVKEGGSNHRARPPAPPRATELGQELRVTPSALNPASSGRTRACPRHEVPLLRVPTAPALHVGGRWVHSASTVTGGLSLTLWGPQGQRPDTVSRAQSWGHSRSSEIARHARGRGGRESLPRVSTAALAKCEFS